MRAVQTRRRRSPRPLAGALTKLTERIEPVGPLAQIQRAWPALADALPVAAEASPATFREGTLTLSCTASVYANELHFLAEEIIAAVNGALGEVLVHSLRVRTSG